MNSPNFLDCLVITPVWHWVSKGVEEGHRLPALRVGHPRNGCKAILAVARLQSIEGSGMAAGVKL
jgi:hypothetical protein